MSVSVGRRIAAIARAWPERTALAGFGADLAEQALTWREFAARVAAAAGALRAALAEPARSCVVVPAANTVPAGIAIAAALAAQVPVFPLNPATPPAERDATPDGFATVGDHGRLDSGGYLYLAPREHETINVGGEKVDPDEVETGLAAHCGTRLAGYKIPKHYTFIDQVPRTAAGKIQRWRLAPPHENGATTS